MDKNVFKDNIEQTITKLISFGFSSYQVQLSDIMTNPIWCIIINLIKKKNRIQEHLHQQLPVGHLLTCDNVL